MKNIIKLIPVDCMDLFEMQAYLNEMAQQGYRLKRVGIWGHFQEAFGQKIEYRLTPFIESGKAAEEKKYKEAGWQYVCSIGQIYGVYDIANATESSIEKNEDIKKYEAINESLKRKGITFVILSLMYIAMFLSEVVFKDTRILQMTLYDAWCYTTAAMIIMLISLLQNIRRVHKMEEIIGRLKSNPDSLVCTNYTTSYMAYLKKNKRNVIEKIVMLIIIVYFIYGIAGSWDKEFEGDGVNLPTIRLKTIEQDENFKIVPSTYHHKAYNVETSYKRTNLASRIYEIEEEGENKFAENDGYEAWIKSTFYEMRFERLAPLLLKDLMQDKTTLWEDEELKCETLTQAGFEEAFYVEAGKRKMLFARTGKKVIYICYKGKEDFKAHINEVYELMNNF